MQAFPGHRSSEVGQEEERGIAHFFDGDIAPKRRVQFIPLQDVAKISDAARSERLDGAGGDGIHADLSLAEIFSNVSYAGLEGGLCDAHYVVVGHHFFGAVVGKREHGATVLHQLLSVPRNRSERVTGDVERRRKVFCCRIDVAALELFLVGEGYGVDDEVERAPFALERGEHGRERTLTGYVAVQDGSRLKRLDEWYDAFFEHFTLVGKRKFRSGSMQAFRHAPGDGAVVGDTHDKAALSRQETID